MAMTKNSTRTSRSRIARARWRRPTSRSSRSAARLHPQQRRLHRLPRLRDRLQGQERPAAGAALPPRDVCRRRHVPGRVRLQGEHVVQPLRRTGLPADLPDRGDLEAREGRHRRHRFDAVHRLPPLRGGLSLWRAAVGPEENIVKKCNMCVDEIEAGRKPYCVMACMMRVLDIGPIDKLRDGTGAPGQELRRPRRLPSWHRKVG
jgi:hypothetical protein